MKAVINILLTPLAFMVSLTGCKHPLITDTNSKIPISDNVECLFASVKADKPEALRILRDASERGNVMCQLSLGSLYEHGRGVPQDIRHAKVLYLSAAQTDRAAYFHLGRLAEEGIGEPVDFQSRLLASAHQYFTL